jgi:hypothetical protein
VSVPCGAARARSPPSLIFTFPSVKWDSSMEGQLRCAGVSGGVPTSVCGVCSVYGWVAFHPGQIPGTSFSVSVRKKSVK